MRLLLVIAPLVALSGCKCPPAPQPPGPTSPTAVTTVIAAQDKVDGKVAAAVTVAKENADKPGIVKSELGVALSFLDAPPEGDLAVARQRAEKARPKEYAAAEAAAKKMAADLEKAQNDLKKNQEESAKVVQKKDDDIVKLNDELGKVKAQGPRQMVLAVSAACFLASLALGLIGQYVRSGVAFAIGTLTAALPVLFDSKWFIPTLGGLLIAAVVAEAVALFLKTRKPAADATPPAQ